MFYGNLWSVASSAAGTGFGNSSTSTFDTSVGARGGFFVPPELLHLDVFGNLTQDSFMIPEGSTVNALSRQIRERQEQHESSSSFNLGGSAFRFVTFTLGTVQQTSQLIENFQPSTPSEQFQSDLYMALDEEGVDPISGAQIFSDPEVQQVVEEVRQYVDKKVNTSKTTQPQQQSSTRHKKLEESVPSPTKTSTSLDPSQVMKLPTVDLEGIVLKSKAKIALKNIAEKNIQLGKQAECVNALIDMAINMGIDLCGIYNIGGHLIRGVRLARAIQSGEKPYKALPEQLEVQKGKPNFFGSYSQAPEFGGPFEKFVSDESGSGKTPFEFWMKPKQNLSVKQQKQLGKAELYGQNPGNITEGPHKGNTRLAVDTELPGGQQGACDFFERFTGERPPFNEPVHTIKIGDQRYTFRPLGDSGHPKVEIERFDSSTNRIILEKITFK